MTTEAVAQGNNFLLPNATFFVELVLFLILFFVIARYIVPPLTKAMDERDEMVRKAATDREKASRKLRDADERYQSELSDARVEAARIRDEARAEAQKVRDEKKGTAEQEVARRREEGERELAGQRTEAMRQLRGNIGGLSSELAERVVGRPLPGDAQRQSTVDRFLAELDERSGTSATSTPSGGGE
ncbi:F0F1 ATP synthase subunit B [Pseudonocardia endophytica]|uniref:ATP synthase subunit b n=1 Tax=Pseudonocardia endophytica TaxID=401976 RepID=A0A4R1HIE7_PSEEN|nr:F0F1 ATP synthase subunit B [Pseudonocardia endophytica]TCK20721.1 F-type H+-transporting ATPase subunit b [Pseudonocardia endophytica]